MVIPVIFKVLIVGLLPYDSGKTTLAMGLIAGLRRLGYKITPFKPISAHNWYTQYNATIVGMKYGIPLSEDIIKLVEAAEVNERFEILNPVDSVTAPLNPGAFWDWHSPSSFYTYASNFFRQVLVSRISFILSDNRIVNYGFLNKFSIEKRLIIFQPEVLSRITRKLGKIEKVEKISFLAEILASNSMPAIEHSLDYLKNKYRVVAIESFNDAAWPLPRNESVDVVVAVAPGQALIYDPEKYKLAVFLREHVMKPYKGAVLCDIFDLIKPIERIEVPPVSYGILPDSIADKLDRLVGIVSDEIEKKNQK